MDSSSPTILSPAPRMVPLTLSVRVVLGGILTQIGWIFVLFGLIFVWAFDAGGALVSAVRFGGELATAEGLVTGWRPTNLSVNDTRVFETLYDFRSADGRALSGGSFGTGSYLDTGQFITVEYVVSNPAISRIQGMRATDAGLGISFVLMFPVVGLVLALAGMRNGLKGRRLLSTGKLALGTLKSKEPTNTRVNEQTVYRLTFEFEAGGGGTYEAVARTHRTYVLEDEPQERLVYDPRNPTDAVLLDELPCRPEIDRRGNFTAEGSGSPLAAALMLLAPGLSLTGYAAYLLSLR